MTETTNQNTKTPYLQIQGLVKKYGDNYAVDSVDLNIERHEIFALLGSSGSGKSTLLRMLAGMERPSQGKILLDGLDVTYQAPYERPINMMFQSYALFPHMSVEQNIAFGLKQDKMAKGEIDARVEDMLKLVQMTKYAKRKPHQLSGGQQQRIALARSLAKRPKLLLLDEPLGALDKKLRQQTQLELVNMLEQVGVTCIMVTHDQEEALEVADRVVVINKGHIEQQGTPQEVWDHPASPFVYGFLGDVNLFHGRAHEGTLHVQGMQLPVPEHATAQNADARAYVRPYDLDVQRAVPGQTSTQGLPAILERAIVVGSLARLELKPTQGHGEAAAPLIEVHLPAQEFRAMGLREGEELLVTPRQARVFVDEAAGI
jgi:spermidine/putrescine ABC transporter ATP-binding subunit